MSNPVRPHRRQPTRLPRPWDSPGKNTGVGCHFLLQCMKVKSESEVAQLCPCLTLRDPMDCSPPGSSVHRIFQPRVLEWGATAFIEDLLCSSGDSTQCCVVTHVAVVLRHSQLFATPWTAAYQAPPSMGFSRQNMLSRLVITFLPRSKHLLISWLQSPFAVILEPRKIKSATVSLSICH